MLSTARLLEVATEQVAEIEERYPGYRKDLVERLVEVLRKQSEGLTQRRRRPEVDAIVGSFAQQVGIKLGTES